MLKDNLSFVKIGYRKSAGQRPTIIIEQMVNQAREVGEYSQFYGSNHNQAPKIV